jgi:hypothetical protein
VGFNLPDDERYHVDIIDTWNMTLETLAAPCGGKFSVPLPARPYLAVRLRRA